MTTIASRLKAASTWTKSRKSYMRGANRFDYGGRM